MEEKLVVAGLGKKVKSNLYAVSSTNIMTCTSKTGGYTHGHTYRVCMCWTHNLLGERSVLHLNPI